MRLSATLFTAVLALLPAACALEPDPSDKGDEEEIPADGDLGKDDSFKKPTDHGAIAFDERVTSELTATQRHHTWTFELTGDAEVEMTTSYAVRGQRRTDTVLYLYKEGPTGWGPYLARNDDYGDTTYSQLVESLDAGRYRVLVKGYLASTRGKFSLTVGCDGAGCAPAVAEDVCLLPEDYTALRADPAFVRQQARVITSAAQLDAFEHEQVLEALRRGWPEIETLDDGFATVDGGEVNLVGYFFTGTNTDLTLVEFGRGDTSVGTIYFGRSLVIAGVIDDLFIGQCALFAPRGDGAAVAGEACRATSDCAAGLACQGVFANEGVCAATANPPGEGAECAVDADCAADLVCAGGTRGYGLCRPSWMRGTFTDAATTAIPDAGTLARRLSVRGLATVDTDVALRATIDHPRASQLRVTLTNPAGNEVVLVDGTAADGAPLVLDGPILHGFSGDESVNGEWTLRVTDRTGGQVGQLAGWELTVTSRWD
jgi:hypothetical protein